MEKYIFKVIKLGKYSPTISEAYRKDQKWFDKYSNGKMYDP